MKQKITFILTIIFLFLTLFYYRGYAKNNEVYRTGLRRPTPEEIEWEKKNMLRTIRILPNQLAINRINNWRMKNHLPMVIFKQASPVGEEIIGVIDGQEVPFIYDNSIQELRELKGNLPSSVDNSLLSSFPPIRSQGSIGSCACFCTTYYQMTHMFGLKRGWDNKNENNNTKFSPKWTYNMINGGYDSGSWLTTAHGVMDRHGCATWTEFPYSGNGGNPLNYREWCLNPAVWRNAISYRLDQMGYLENIDTDEGLLQLKQLLVNGYVLTFATYVISWQYMAIKDDPSTSEDDAFVGKDVCYWAVIRRVSA